MATKATPTTTPRLPCLLPDLTSRIPSRRTVRILPALRRFVFALPQEAGPAQAFLPDAGHGGAGGEATLQVAAGHRLQQAFQGTPQGRLFCRLAGTVKAFTCSLRSA